MKKKEIGLEFLPEIEDMGENPSTRVIIKTGDGVMWFIFAASDYKDDLLLYAVPNQPIGGILGFGEILFSHLDVRGGYEFFRCNQEISLMDLFKRLLGMSDK